MASELYNTIDALSREKGIDPHGYYVKYDNTIVFVTVTSTSPVTSPAKVSVNCLIATPMSASPCVAEL